MQRNFTFIIIDDNVIDILIYKLILKNVFPDSQIIYFTEPQDGLDFIKDQYQMKNEKEIILFLDINMPVMNGWEFLQEFERLNQAIKSRIRINIVSFYADSENMKLADANPTIQSVISKPINKEKLLSAINSRRVARQN